MVQPWKVDHSSIKATIDSIVRKALLRHGLTMDELRQGKITAEVKACFQEITQSSTLTGPAMLMAYTNISAARIIKITQHQ